MVFSSLLFLTRFLPAVMILYFAVTGIAGLAHREQASHRLRNLVLLCFSLIFYAWGEPVYVLLMIFTITVDYLCGLFVDRFKKRQKDGPARAAMIVAIVINLALLGFFKYANFAIDTVNGITGQDFALLDLALPIGISFYTFQALSYVIDVYRGATSVQKNVFDFGTYVTLFPQLIAGPIVRYRTVADEMEGRQENITDFSRGIGRFVTGLGKKVLIANNVGVVWDTVTALPAGGLSVLTAWLGIIAYTFQIYFDFSAYSDMAIGMGLMFGFHFDENFEHPYVSKSVTEFWRRWHISLSTWFKEYVYIPLGGNRKGMARQIRNILIVWFLTGFWHGASWNFMFWGLYYGVLLIVEKVFLLKRLEKAPAWVRHVYTMFIVVIGWVLFAFDSWRSGAAFLGAMFGGGGAAVDRQGLYLLVNNIVLFVIAAIGATEFPQRIYRMLCVKLAGEKGEKDSAILMVLEGAVLLSIALLSIAYLVDASYNPFLYFRF